MKQLTRTTVTLVLLGLLALGGSVGYYMYQKPHADLKRLDADFSLAASELFHEYEANETEANARYLNKVVSIKGTLAEKTVLSDNEAVLFIRPDDAMFGVSCSFSGEEAQKALALNEGEQLAVKGVCTGINMDVNLVRCVFDE